MRRALLFIVVGLLAVPSAFCTRSLLRLERAPSPLGIWEEVPANELPITDEGAFLDEYGSVAGYYRMKIQQAGWFPELNIPVEQIQILPYIEDILYDLMNAPMDNGWLEGELGPFGFPIYDPLTGDPAFMEFKVVLKETLAGPGALAKLTGESPSALLAPPIHREKNLGFILFSMTEDEAPFIEYSMEGLTRTERLRELAKSSAVKIFRYGDSLLAAENDKGELVAYIGVPPVYYPDDILEYCDQEFEGYGDEQGGKHPDPLPFKGEPYPSYQNFKEAWAKAKRFQLARERRKQDAKILWDIYTGKLQKNTIYVTLGQETTAFPNQQIKQFTLADPTLATVRIPLVGVSIMGKALGQTTFHVVFGDGSSSDGYLAVLEKALSPEQPTIGWTSWTEYYAGSWSDQRRYTQEWGGSCYSGCGATAWAMLYGWFDYRGLATNLIAGSAPLYNNDSVRDCIWYIVPEIGTYCVGDQGATNPWEMYKGYKWAQHRGEGYSYSYSWTIPCFSSSSARNKARDAIKNDGRAAIIGIGCTSAHYPLAYGYKYREWKGAFGEVWATERKFKCNMGWGGSSAEWKNGDVWFGLRSNFW